ncbi:Holliday junction branch migration protein RuvA [Aureibaculum sp. 2210JD6-5]|uniref:Holliday junction branch migration protein RuvA n=1 Tax=Aureibaculum sp. 2210JD6-5 TaxID=3103957 RepID=UPI002AAE394E|nr:Holliday junction branch migration protein RuvA [Aureibaculum sp. 2210JD6-5]MDY7394582.1 Holliday junction branch migration protein RuvA [Aureibaculum sp. 2210JD6-5]
MITHLNGKLVEKNPTYVIIECNGVGYFLHISLNTFAKIPDAEALKLYTYLNIKEDSHTLFGFADKVEREIFKLLISVSGVGPSIGRTMLSSMTPEEIQRAIASEDVATIQSVKGIGAKTAQRVIIDLRDKIVKTYEISEDSASNNNTIKDEALSALEVLGFSRKQVEKLVQKIIQETPDTTLENIIKQALKNL